MTSALETTTVAAHCKCDRGEAPQRSHSRVAAWYAEAMRHTFRPRTRGIAALPILLLALTLGLPAQAGTAKGAVPLTPMTRGQFVSELLAALNVPLLRDPPPVFGDVPPTSPEFAAIATAQLDGLAQGVGPSLFGPARPVSAIAAATMALKAYSPVAAAWADQRGYLPVAVELGLLPTSFLEAPRHALDLMQGRRLIMQAAALHAAAGPGGWQWLAAAGGGAAKASAIMDVLVAAVSHRPLSSVALQVDPSAWAAVNRSYQRIAKNFSAFAALAPGVGWRVVGGGLWAVKPLGAGRYSADAALVLETVNPLTELPDVARQSAWLGWPSSSYFRFDFGEVDVTEHGVAGLNNLKGEVALSSLPGTLPSVVQSGVQAYPDWSVMAVGVATTYPTITAPAPTADSTETSFRADAGRL